MRNKPRIKLIPRQHRAYAAVHGFKWECSMPHPRPPLAAGLVGFGATAEDAYWNWINGVASRAAKKN